MSAVQCPVGSKLVVDALEAVELGLQLLHSDGGGLGCEPALQSLVKAFDFALSLRMVGVAVLLRDAQAGEQVFEAVAAAGEAGGVDRPVVCEGGVRKSVGVGCGQEGGDHVLTADPWPSNGGEKVSGVVIEPVDDLHDTAVG